MKYGETDLTEATKIISYLRSIRTYAITILFSSLLYAGLIIFSHIKGAEAYLLYYFAGFIIIGSLSVTIRLNYKTAIIYGFSCIIAGVIFSFSLLYFRGGTLDFLAAVGFLAAFLVIRHGVSVAFGSRLKEALSKGNQKKVAFVENLLNALKQSLPNERDVVNCDYTDDRGKKRRLRIKLLDYVACFLLSGHSAPIFCDRHNVFISELENTPNYLRVSIILYNHDWLEAEIKSDDFKKYEGWKNL